MFSLNEEKEWFGQSTTTEKQVKLCKMIVTLFPHVKDNLKRHGFDFMRYYTGDVGLKVYISGINSVKPTATLPRLTKFLCFSVKAAKPQSLACYFFFLRSSTQHFHDFIIELFRLCNRVYKLLQFACLQTSHGIVALRFSVACPSCSNALNSEIRQKAHEGTQGTFVSTFVILYL